MLGPQAAQKYIVCNADEGDSGTFSDRMLMEGDPFMLIEGMTIAGLAVGATQGYIYLRSEYPHAVAVLDEAIANRMHAWLSWRHMCDTSLLLSSRFILFFHLARPVSFVFVDCLSIARRAGRLDAPTNDANLGARRHVEVDALQHPRQVFAIAECKLFDLHKRGQTNTKQAGKGSYAVLFLDEQVLTLLCTRARTRTHLCTHCTHTITRKHTSRANTDKHT